MLKLYGFATYSLAALLALALVIPSLAQAQSEKKVKATEEKTDAQKSRGTGPDENIKSQSTQNDPNNASKAPPTKGGEKTRGGWCDFRVDNRTPWKIQMFVDGDYVGLVSGWGNASGSYSGGSHVIYGVADFNDGSKITWGPNSISCFGTYNWRLTDSSHGYN